MSFASSTIFLPAQSSASLAGSLLRKKKNITKDHTTLPRSI